MLVVWENFKTYRHTDIQTYRHTDIQTYRHTDIQTYRQSSLMSFSFDVKNYISLIMSTDRLHFLEG